MEIFLKQILDKDNLITFRRKLQAAELQVYAEKMLAYAKQHGANKISGGITATYAVEGDLMDVEVYLPLDKEVPSSDEFVFKPWLYLENCVMATHKGNPQLLEATLQKINDFIAENELTPISAGFIATVVEVTDVNDLDMFEVDVYISVSPNVV